MPVPSLQIIVTVSCNFMELLKRTIFGGLYVGLVLSALLLQSAVLYVCVFGILVFLGICEYEVLVRVNRTRPLRTILDGVAAAYLFYAIYAYIFSALSETIGAAVFAPYMFYILYTFVRALYSDRDFMPGEIAKIFLGQVYVGGGMASAHAVAYWNGFFVPELFLLIAFVAIWANDTGAFIAGSTLGRHRLFPSISPKKSWEGFAGGMLASVAAVLTLGYYLYSDLELAQMIVLGIVISIFATWGDLFESMLKRQAGVKDSGKIIPGHGGVLDRIDSVLFVLPAVLWVKLIFALL